MTPGMQVRVVNSYAAASDLVPVNTVRMVDLPTEGKPAIDHSLESDGCGDASLFFFQIYLHLSLLESQQLKGNSLADSYALLLPCQPHSTPPHPTVLVLMPSCPATTANVAISDLEESFRAVMVE